VTLFYVILYYRKHTTRKHTHNNNNNNNNNRHAHQERERERGWGERETDRVTIAKSQLSGITD